MAEARPLVLTFGHEELVVRQRYEVLSIINDIFIALWFLAGSVMYFYPSWSTLGTWCFVAGSLELMVRPLLRLIRRVHLGRIGEGDMPTETAADF